MMDRNALTKPSAKGGAHWSAHLTLGVIIGALIGLSYFPLLWAYSLVTDLVGWQWNGYAFPIITALVLGVPLGIVMMFRERRKS